MSVAEGLTSEFEKQLVEYLLSTQPACLTIVGQLEQAKRWASAGTADTTAQVQQFDTLAECHAASQAATGESSEGPSVALLHLLHDDDRLQGDDALATELGKAVRRFPERLVVSIDSTEPADTAFFAFGFRKLQLTEQGAIRLFEYCLSEYKQPPDWLNARYWANPDRFENDEDSDIYSEDYGDDEE